MGGRGSAFLGSSGQSAYNFCFSSWLSRKLLCRHLVLPAGGHRCWALIFPSTVQLAREHGIQGWAALFTYSLGEGVSRGRLLLFKLPNPFFACHAPCWGTSPASLVLEHVSLHYI